MTTVDISLQYTVMMTGASIANFASLRLASHFGFIWVYSVSTVIALIVVLFIFIFCRKTLPTVLG